MVFDPDMPPIFDEIDGEEDQRVEFIGMSNIDPILMKVKIKKINK